MGRFRYKKDEKHYKRLRDKGHLEGGCKLCEHSSIKEFQYWKIIENSFPYTRIAQLHHMIIPKRHIKEEELSQEEWMEYREVKNGYINENYEFIIEPTQRKKSIPAHFHLHLVIAKD